MLKKPRKLARKLKGAWLICFAITAASCSQIQIKDAKVCSDLGALGASCNHTLVDRPERIEKAAWDKERFGQLCTKSESFENWITAIDQFCYSTKRCSYEEVSELKKISARLKRDRKTVQDIEARKKLEAQ